MRKFLTTAMAVLTLGGAVAATAAPAQARDYYRYDRGHHRGNGDTAIAAGVVGLALGAALASSNNNRSGGYYSSGYDTGYYGPRHRSAYGYSDGYARPYRTCIQRERVYDPYIGRRVIVERSFAC